MKILYHHRIGSRDGQFIHVESMIKSLKELDHEVHVVGPDIESQPVGRQAGIVKSARQMLPMSAAESAELAYSGPAYLRLRRAIEYFKPDVIYERYNLFFPAGIWAARQCGLPILVEVNAPLAYERTQHGGLSLRRIAEWSERYVWSNADHVFCVTQVLAKFVADRGVPASRITVTQNGVDLEETARAPSSDVAKKRLGLADKTVLGFVGFVRSWHGLEQVVDFLSRSRDRSLHLVVVGDGPALPELREQARRLGIADQLSTVGAVSHDKVIQFVAAFDIALQPRAVEYCSPLKVFEYMALGKAIVAPRQPNICEILRHEEDALLFEPVAWGSFALALDRLIKDVTLRKSIGMAARQTLREREYTWAKNARVISDVAGSVLTSRHAS